MAWNQVRAQMIPFSISRLWMLQRPGICFLLKLVSPLLFLQLGKYGLDNWMNKWEISELINSNPILYVGKSAQKMTTDLCGLETMWTIPTQRTFSEHLTEICYKPLLPHTHVFPLLFVTTSCGRYNFVSHL